MPSNQSHLTETNFCLPQFLLFLGFLDFSVVHLGYAFQLLRIFTGFTINTFFI